MDINEFTQAKPDIDDAANGFEPAQAWAMIEPGRYQPRRIRGSLLGRELG